MEFEVIRTLEEVDEADGRCSDQINGGGSKYPGMSYEEGFQAALQWLQDDLCKLDDVL